MNPPAPGLAEVVRGAALDVSPLHAAAVANSTFAAYRFAVLGFADWADSREEMAFTVEALDKAVDAYALAQFRNNPARGSRQQVVNTVMGLEFLIPALKSRLQTARVALRGWNRLEPKASPPPMSWLIMNGVAREWESREAWALGISLRLLFGAYLRATEVLDLLVSDVALPGDPRLQHWGAADRGGVRLRRTKTGPEQFVELEDPVLLQLLSWYAPRRLTAVGPDGPLAPVSYTALSAGLRRGLTMLGLDWVGFVLHSLRHGGATSDLLRGIDLGRIVQKGRWRDQQGARTYLQSGRALLLGVSLSPAVRERLAQHERASRVALAQWRGGR